MSLVNFKRGTLAEYKTITPDAKDANTLYFVTDQGLLYLGSKLIAATEVAQKVDGVYTITYIDSTNTAQTIDVVTSTKIDSLIPSAISTAIGNLDGTATIVSESNDVVTLTTSVTETDGVISAGSSTVTLGNAAKKTVLSGTIADAVAAHKADSSETTINNLTTAAQVSDYVDTKLTGIVGALVYRGTIGSQESGATKQTLPTDASMGDVYVVKTADTYANEACEVGDMIIYNGETWNVVNGENQVTNSAATLSLGATNATTIATVDGTDITLKIGTLTVSDTGSGNVVSGVSVSGDTMTLTRTDVIASITGETAISGGNSNLVAVTATTSSNATTLASSVKTQTLASATSSADGLATAYDIQQNVAANCVLANYTTVIGGTVATSNTINEAINKLEKVLVWGSF